MDSEIAVDFQQRQREAVTQVVGRISLSWAYVEMTIDGTIAILHDYFGGSKLENYRPQVFSRKLSYLTKGARTLPQMRFLELDMPAIQQLNALSEIRNWVIHGYLHAIEDDGKLTFKRHAKGKGFPAIEERIFFFQDLNLVVRDIQLVGTQLRGLMDHLLDHTEQWSVRSDA